MPKYTETREVFFCDFCGDDIDNVPFEYKGKYYCDDCKEDLKKLLKEDDE